MKRPIVSHSVDGGVSFQSIYSLYLTFFSLQHAHAFSFMRVFVSKVRQFLHPLRTLNATVPGSRVKQLGHFLWFVRAFCW